MTQLVKQLVVDVVLVVKITTGVTSRFSKHKTIALSATPIVFGVVASMTADVGRRVVLSMGDWRVGGLGGARVQLFC